MIQSPEAFLEQAVAEMFDKRVRASSDLLLETLVEMLRENGGAIFMAHVAQRLCRIYDYARTDFQAVLYNQIKRKGSEYFLEAMRIEEALRLAFPEAKNISYRNNNELPKKSLLIYQSQEGLVAYTRSVARVSKEGVATFAFRG
jgi:hypothetical protein